MNCAPSISGRYPNGGPDPHRRAPGIPLLDDVGLDADGPRAGRRRRPHRTGRALAQRRTPRSRQRCSTGPRSKPRWRTARATHRHRARALRRQHARVHPEGGAAHVRAAHAAADRTPTFAGRHVLVVVRGHDYREDLAALRPYIREYRPVLIGVDGGADALLEHRVQARHHHRRLRLRVGDGPRTAAPSSCTTCTPTGGRPVARTCSNGASTTSSSWPRAPARTSPCCSPTSPGAS